MGVVELCCTGNPPIAGGFVLISHCLINRDILPIRPLLWLSAIIPTCEEIATVKVGSCLMHLGYNVRNVPKLPLTTHCKGFSMIPFFSAISYPFLPLCL